MRFCVIDGCPCPRPLYPVLRKLKAETGCTFNSIYRGEGARALLHRHGKHTQAELYQLFLAGQGAPANPPGASTHELFSDAAAYPGVPRGERLRWWQCGLDVNDADVPKVIAAARRHGWHVFRPYSSASEAHHVNFRRRPRRWRLFFHHVFGGKR